MALTMTSEVVFPADQETVWRGLNDPELLRSCITHCDRFERLSDDTFHVSGSIKLGPVRSRLEGRILLSEVDAPNGCRMSAEGVGGLAKLARGQAVMRLADTGRGGTRLTYELSIDMGGRLAQLMGRVVGSVAQSYADVFFGRFADALSSRVEGAGTVG